MLYTITMCFGFGALLQFYLVWVPARLFIAVKHVLLSILLHVSVQHWTHPEIQTPKSQLLVCTFTSQQEADTHNREQQSTCHPRVVSYHTVRDSSVHQLRLHQPTQFIHSCSSPALSFAANQWRRHVDSFEITHCRQAMQHRGAFFFLVCFVFTTVTSTGSSSSFRH